MKKRTNKVLCEDIVKRAWMVENLIKDIHLIKREAMKMQLQGEIKKVIIDVIKIYDNQLKEIEAKNWINWHNRGEQYLFRTFTKPYLTDFDERLVDDMDNLSEYQNELLTAMDKIHNMRTKKEDYSEYNLYDAKTNNWVDGGNFKSMDAALTAIEKSWHLKTGWKYFIVGDNKKATFDYTLVGDIENVKIIPLKNTVQVTCETLDSSGWVHTTYQTTDYKINDLMLNLRTNRNVRSLGEPEPIPTKEYQYTYKLRGFSLGCQPKQGFIRWEKLDYFKYEVIYYDRQLTQDEINNYELVPLN